MWTTPAHPSSVSLIWSQILSECKCCLNHWTRWTVARAPHEQCYVRSKPRIGSSQRGQSEGLGKPEACRASCLHPDPRCRTMSPACCHCCLPAICPGPRLSPPIGTVPPAFLVLELLGRFPAPHRATLGETQQAVRGLQSTGQTPGGAVFFF